ncbi:MAG: hypothetical protein JWM78_807 [Verrucomicrobiaceae bacterium]|nr:hypothetical protein [Verrucomicrobiaceae bacterium]
MVVTHLRMSHRMLSALFYSAVILHRPRHTADTLDVIAFAKRFMNDDYDHSRRNEILR